MLRFYDQLRRQSQQVKRFEELIDEALGADDVDRGAAADADQTRFLAGAFREYERASASPAACDEHALRERLIAEAAADPIRRARRHRRRLDCRSRGAVSVADFDLLTRIPGLETLDIVATERVLAPASTSGCTTGARPRGDRRSQDDEPARNEPDGAEHESSPDAARSRPTTDPGSPPAPRRTSRGGRCAIAKRSWSRSPAQSRAEQRGERVAARPDRGRLQAAAAVPLSRRRDLSRRRHSVPDVRRAAAGRRADRRGARSGARRRASRDFTRDSLIALLRRRISCSRSSGRHRCRRDAVSALDRASERARGISAASRGSRTICRAATTRLRRRSGAAPRPRWTLAPRRLRRSAEPAPASVQLKRLPAGVLVRSPAPACRRRSDSPARERRARAALVATMLRALAAVHAAHDDPDWTIDELGASPCGAGSRSRRSTPDSGGRRRAAARRPGGPLRRLRRHRDRRPGRADWPERPRRNIFYPPALLKALGWPSEKDRRAAADARFLDLLRRRRAPDDAVDLHARRRRARLAVDAARRDSARAVSSIAARRAVRRRAVFADEALSLEPMALEHVRGRRARVGGAADARARRPTRRIPRRRARPPAPRVVVGQRARNLSRTARSSSSRSTSSSSRRSRTTKR